MRKAQVGSRGGLSPEWWWRDGGGGISQGEVKTGAGEGGLVFLEVEKSRPIILAKKSREKMGHPGKGWVRRKLGRHRENQPGAKG